jgi:hypothetical protein
MLSVVPIRLAFDISLSWYLLNYVIHQIKELILKLSILRQVDSVYLELGEVDASKVFIILITTHT